MRLKEFDILKGIGILLVLLGHTGISGLLYTFIYAFHMPLFFFASGCFHKQKDSMSFIKKKVKGLLLPYLFFVACFFIMSVFLECMQSHSLSIGILSTISSLNPMNEHCWILYRTIWFLLCLFEISVIYHIIDRLEHLRWSRDNGSAHCDMPQNVVLGRPGGGVILFAVIGFILSRQCDYQCFYLDSACSCILYYALGHYFRIARFDERHMSLTSIMCCGFALLTAVAVLLPDVALVRNRYPFYLPLIATAMTVTLFYVIKRCHQYDNKLSKCISWLGENSLSILGIHSIYYYLFDYYFSDKFSGLQFVSLKFFMTLPLIYISVILVKMLVPNIFGKYETKRI